MANAELSGTPTMPAAAVRDDRILPVTRWVGACIPPFLFVAFVMLFFFPNNTKDLFAWDIHPPLTPLLMGAGYISGSYFFVRLIFGQRWHRFALGFLPIATFTWFMGLSSVLHFDKFNGNQASIIAWMFLYALTPFVVPALWLINRRTDPGTPEPGDVLVPPAIRWTTGVVGAGMVTIALVMFLFPDLFTTPKPAAGQPFVSTGLWPWWVSPLTDQVIAGWFALPGVVGLMLASDRRWSAWRITLESQLLGVGLILIGVARAWSDLNPINGLTWLFLAGMIGLLGYLLGVYLVMESRRRRAVAAPPA